MLPTSFFAKNLIFLMEEFGITQQRLADELGVSQTAISKYLKGRVPRAETLLELANYFPDVQVADLLYKDLSMGKAAGRIVQKKRRNCALLMERLNELPEEKAESLANALRTILNHMIDSGPKK
jgi:transcriptional regulator with XRE-family HTH domain